MNKDWIKDYGKRTPQKFQEGGPMGPPPEAAPEAAPPEAAGGAPDLEGMLAEYAQSRDPQLAVAICDALVEMMAAEGGGGGAPGGPPPGAGGAPGGPPPGPPMAKKGAKLRRGPVFKK